MQPGVHAHWYGVGVACTAAGSDWPAVRSADKVELVPSPAKLVLPVRRRSYGS